MINCLIIDDEPAAREILENYIEHVEQLVCVQSCINVPEAASALKNNKIDLIFLDINMPVINGLEFYKSLINPPLVVFTTAYPEYAIEGFEVNAIDYLLKPIAFDRFTKAVDKVLKILPSHLNYIMLKADKKIYRMLIKDIIRLESMGDYVKVFTNDDSILVHDTLQNLNNKLPEQSFIQTHRSHIINMDKIESTEGNMIHLNGCNIPIGNTFKTCVFNKA